VLVGYSQDDITSFVIRRSLWKN